MFRPAKLGRDPHYALSDPAHQYIPGVTETFLGPLTRSLGLREAHADIVTRERLYRGLHPDPEAGESLFPRGTPPNYRPVIGGNFHAPKTLDIWLSGLAPVERMRAEMLFAKCCKEVVEQRILRDMVRRTGHAGGGPKEPVAAMAVQFLHATNAAGHYHLHVLVEVHNVGRDQRGRVGALASRVLFENQERYSREAEARVMKAFDLAYGLVLRRGPNGSLEVKGLEAARGVPTPRQGEMRAELARRNMADTPGGRDRAALYTHGPRDPHLSADAAADRTARWWRERGIEPLAAERRRDPRRSPLAEDRLAETAVTRAINAAQRLAARFSLGSLRVQALREAVRNGADHERVTRIVGEFAADVGERERFGVTRLASGLFSTAAIERAHDRLARVLARLAAGNRAVARDPDGPTADTKRMLDLYRTTGREVHVVAGPATAAAVEAELGARAALPERFAADLSTGRERLAFLAAVKRPPDALPLSAVGDKSLVPDVKIAPGDVVVLDLRAVGARAAAHIAAAAERAMAYVVVVGRMPEPSPERIPDRTRDPN